MKRILAVVLSGLFCVLLFGCAKEMPQGVTPPPESTIIVALETIEPSETAAASIVQQTEPMSPTPSESAEPTPLPYVADEGVYTIAWMSDPQHYSKKFPEVYESMTAFLRDHQQELNLGYVINTGDLVHNPEEESQWMVADGAQAEIDAIPNGVLAGNHDVSDELGFEMFCKYFGKKRFADKPWYGGSFENNRGHFDLIRLGQTDYVFVYMGYGPTDEAIRWVYDTLKAYPERVGVLCLHDYYTKTQTLSEDGKKWYERVVKRSPNLYMVLCGHKYGAYCFPETFDDDKNGTPDRTVYQMLFNYQASLHDGGGGYLRLIQIDESNGTMRTLTYSPYLDDFNRFDDPENREEYYPFNEQNEEFTLPLPWRMN